MSQKLLIVIAALISGSIGAWLFALGPLSAATGVQDSTYTAVTPCAAFDSRTSQGATGDSAGPLLGDKANGDFTGTNNKTYQITGALPDNQGGAATCNIPLGAAAVHINIVALNPLTAGNLVVTDANGTPPSGGIVNYQVIDPPLNNSNAFNVPLLTGGALDVYANYANNCAEPTVDVRGVILGYYTNQDSTPVCEAEVTGLTIHLIEGDTGGIGGNPRADVFELEVTNTGANPVGLLEVGYLPVGDDGTIWGALRLFFNPGSTWVGYTHPELINPGETRTIEYPADQMPADLDVGSGGETITNFIPLPVDSFCPAG